MNHTVVMTDDLTFEPAQLTIAPGDSVTWTNPSGHTHNATSLSGEPEFETRNLRTGETSDPVTFPAVTEVDYECTIHSGIMTGHISVV